MPTSQTVSHFQRKYTRELQDAVCTAALDRGVAPARRIQEDIRAGRFQLDGVTFDAQEVSLDSVRGWIREERQRRMGKVESPLAKLGSRDAVEVLRIRLLSSADSMLKHQEEKRRDKRDPERMRQIARLIREAAAIPGQQDPRPVAPGQRGADGKHNGAGTEGGLAGQILSAHRKGETAQSDPYHTRDDGERGAAQHAGTEHSDTAQQDTVHAEGSPGAQNTERVGRLLAGHTMS